MLLVFAILLIIILVVLVRCIVIVPQSNAYVTEWLGVYKDTWGAGLHIRTPFVERISRKVSLKEEAADFPPQPVITRDNVTMMIDTVVFFQVFDAKMYAYGVNRPIQASEKESAILRAEAVKQQRIREAEGEAEALLTVQKAQADAIRMINEANPNHNYLALRSMEAMEKVADGKATKLIVPSDMQNLAATVSAIKEISGEVTE